MTVCKVCYQSFDASRVIGEVCTALQQERVIEHFRVKCAQQYLAKPAFVCKSCFNTVEKYTETKQTVTAALETAFTVTFTTFTSS